MNALDSGFVCRTLLEKSGITKALKGNITELAINEPLYHWTENDSGWEQHKNEQLTVETILALVRCIGVLNGQRVDSNNPIASLTLPDGERCQIVLPPVCLSDTYSITIRKPSKKRFSLADYKNSGRFNPRLSEMDSGISLWEKELEKFIEQRDYESFFKLAVKHCLNIVTVGGTGSGKTTFSKTLIDLYPAEKRIFTIEDAHELDTPNHPNSVHLFLVQAYQQNKSCLVACE